MTTQAKKPLFWIDLEMTGLDEKTDHILEVCAVITDWNLKTLESFHRVVWQPADILAGMNDWCKENHGKSGLTADVSKVGKPLREVEAELIALVDPFYPEALKDKDARIVLAGNSIGNDRRFIDAYWPELAKRLHYRQVDVSSFKEVFRERYGKRFDKKNTHRATEDILESIRELEYYLGFVK